MSVGDSPPFFTRQPDGGFAPDWIARSPWREGVQNGLAVGGLMAHIMLEARPPEGMNIARFTMDILRPAPMATTRAVWKTLRDGRRTIVMEGVLLAGDDTEVARATALFVRRAVEGAPATRFPPPDIHPDDAPREYMLPRGMGLESRLIQKGTPSTPQPKGRVWVRQDAPTVADGAMHPIVCAVQAADFAGSLSSGIDREKWLSPNVDIAIHFVRPPHQEWVLVESEALLLGNGAVTVEAQLNDLDGLFAHSHVTLVTTAVSANEKRVKWP